MRFAATTACLGILPAALWGAVLFPAMPSRACIQAATHRLAPGDTISVTVLGHAEFSIATAKVQTDGTIVYFYGAIPVGGNSLADVERKVAAVLVREKQLVKPVVAVGLIAREARLANVYGPVRNPGKVELRDGARILDVLASTGGLSSDRLEFFRLTIYRADGTSQPVDLVKLYSGDATLNGEVRHGDNLVVVELEPARTLVQAVGEVRNPVSIVVPKGGSMIALLNAAGGTTATAALSRAVILRDGQSIKVDLRPYLTNGILSAEATLKPGDTLVVPANRDTYRINGSISKSGEIPYPDDRKIMLMEAVSAAGIPVNGANLRKVRLTQKGPDGTDNVTLIDVERILKGDRSRDVEVHPGDSIFVPMNNPRRNFSIQDIAWGLGAVATLFRLVGGLR